jgi:hypothetical protein
MPTGILYCVNLQRVTEGILTTFEMLITVTEMVTDMGDLGPYLGSGFLYVILADIKRRNYRLAVA